MEAQAVSRSAAGPVEVLIVVNPCFGLDIASTEEIRTRIMQVHKRRAAVLLLVKI
jgi:simple sugar transport system ATP-binding protein